MRTQRETSAARSSATRRCSSTSPDCASSSIASTCSRARWCRSSRAVTSPLTSRCQRSASCLTRCSVASASALPAPRRSFSRRSASADCASAACLSWRRRCSAALPACSWCSCRQWSRSRFSWSTRSWNASRVFCCTATRRRRWPRPAEAGAASVESASTLVSTSAPAPPADACATLRLPDSGRVSSGARSTGRRPAVSGEAAFRCGSPTPLWAPRTPAVWRSGAGGGRSGPLADFPAVRRRREGPSLRACCAVSSRRENAAAREAMWRSISSAATLAAPAALLLPGPGPVAAAPREKATAMPSASASSACEAGAAGGVVAAPLSAAWMLPPLSMASTRDRARARERRALRYPSSALVPLSPTPSCPPREPPPPLVRGRRPSRGSVARMVSRESAANTSPLVLCLPLHGDSAGRRVEGGPRGA